MTEEDLRALDGNGLRDLADQVGVGYADLDDDSLINKLMFEGRPEES